MPVDPFRIQFLTVTLDSQAVLTVVGLVLAGLVFGLAARRARFEAMGAGAWWDVVTAAVIGARIVWVATHLDYYLRGPLQALVITDGGLHPVGLVLGASYGVWRLGREQGGNRDLGQILQFVALGALVTVLFERTGCALTTCGGGPPTELAWSLRRGDELRQPLALYQIAILAPTLLLATEVPRLATGTWTLALMALVLVELVSVAWGGRGPEGLAALVLAAVLALGASSWSARRPRPWLAPLPAASTGGSGG